MKRAEHVLTEFEIVRIAEDRDGKPFVEVLILETGQKRRLYESERLSLIVDLPAEAVKA